MEGGAEKERLTCEEKTPKASHRLKRSMGGVPSNPPMSDVQNPNPLIPKLNPPLKLSAIASHVLSQSPPQWTGHCWPPAVAERANRTASFLPSLRSRRSKTSLLYFHVYQLCIL